MKNRNKMNNNGFSLVELIIVIAIMAVLIGVLAPQYMKYVERGRAASDNDNILAVEDAVKVYYVDTEATKSFHDNIVITFKPDADPTVSAEDTDKAVEAAIRSAGLVNATSGEVKDLPRLTNKQTFKEATITITIDGGNISTVVNRTDY